MTDDAVTSIRFSTRQDATEAQIADTADRIIALVEAARDAEIRDALLSDKSKNAASRQMQELAAQGVWDNRVLAYEGMKAALDHIGLHGDGTGGQ